MIKVYKIKITMDGRGYDNEYRFLMEWQAQGVARKLSQLKGIKAEVITVIEEKEGGSR